MTPPISRRQALVLLAGGAAVAGGGLAAITLVGDESADAPVSAAQTPPVPTGEVAVIGERYLVQFPDESSVAVLSQLVDLPRPGAPGAFAAARDRLREELARGEVVSVDGWVLARTEARLCALVALGQ